MLQQTQVGTVIPYFNRFMTDFPQIGDLARAPMEKVLKVWEGLGYYARARSLHRTAGVLMDHYQGEIPSDLETLAGLPGIGRSTAGAIRSIAFEKKAPILDGNVRRVLSRLFAIQEEPARPETQRRLWEISESLLPAKNISSFNQALMDLGALICTPKGPNCPECCLSSLCQAYKKGIQESIPQKAPSKRIPHYPVAVGVIWKKDQILVTQRPPKGLLGGLWEFPGGKIEEGETPEMAVEREIREELGIRVAVNEYIGTVRHAYSHFRITLHAYHCRYQRGTIRTENPHRWVTENDLDLLAFPAANRKIIQTLSKNPFGENLGKDKKRKQ